MSNIIVFDSSAFIALLAKEKGFETIQTHLRNAVISSVNVAEIYKYCIDVQKLTESECQDIIAMSGIKIIDFDEKQSLITAKIYPTTKKYGLSIGDIACVSLAIINNCPIITCDRIWKNIKLNVEFIMVR